MKTIKLTIVGMHCGSCAGNVERALGKIKGISKIGVSVLLNRATIESAEAISQDVLKKAITSAGYTLVKVE